MKEIFIRKAQATLRDQKVESVKIVLQAEAHMFGDLEEASEFYDNEAEDLAEVLINTLPGGTLTRLTGKLLAHHASLFCVPLTQSSPTSGA